MPKQRVRDIKHRKIKPERKKEKESDFIYATSRMKIKAFLTDAFMLIMPIMYVVFYFVFDGREAFSQNKTLGWFYILYPMIFVQTLFFYFTGQTPGYKAYNLYLIDQHTKVKPTFFIILFRNLAAILTLFTFSWILMFFRRDSKTLHDFLSATSVVQKPEL